MQHVDLLAGGAKSHDLIANLHNVGEANFVEALGEAQSAYFGSHG
jgi:hypothetical protein